MARFLDSTSSIKKEAGKKKKKQETTQQKQTTQSPSYSQKVQQTNQRLTQKYGGGGSGGSARGSSSQPTTQQRQNQKSYGQPTQPVRRNQAELQRQKEERRQQAQDQKMGLNSRGTTEQRQAARRAVRNTPAVARESARQAAIGHGKTAADITAATNSSALGSRAEFKSRAFQEDIEKRRSASTKAAEHAFSELTKRQERSEKRLQKLTKNAKGVEKAYYGALESGIGMATDALIGAGTGQAGALTAMASRTYGLTRGTAQKEGATENEDRLYSLAQGAKEAGTELMFPGAGLAKRAYGRAGLSLAEKGANLLTRRLTGKAADVTRAGLRLAGGVGEENLEEVAGWGLDPLIKEFTYGRRTRERDAEEVMKRISNNLRSNIKSEEDAQSASAYLSSPDFIEETKRSYMQEGMSEADAAETAEKMRDYLAAGLSGDTATMTALEDEVSKKIAKGKKLEWDRQELKDTIASTTLLTGVTGLPGTLTTTARGAGIRDALGDDGVRALANTAIDFEDEQLSYKGQAARDRIDSGKSLTATQVYDLAAGQAEQERIDRERVNASRAMASKALRDNDLVSPFSEDNDGNITDIGEATEKAYNEAADSAVASLRRVASENNKESLTDRELDRGRRAIAGFKTGVFTVNDANELNFSNGVVREAFKAETGIDLDQYIVRDKSGNVNIPATNTATKNALFAMAADNLVQSAEAETVNWMDTAKGETVTQVSARMGAEGSLALQKALDDVDERDRSTYMMTANAADMLYQTGRNMGVAWDSIKDEAKSIFPNISEDKLRSMYEAGLADKEAADSAMVGLQIKIGEKIKTDKVNADPKGNVLVETEVVPKGTTIRVFSEIAANLGVDIHLVDDLRTGTGNQANGQYIDGNIYINVNSDFESNLGYIFMHEVTHHLKLYAPEQYHALENLVREKWFDYDASQMQNEIAKRIDLYARNGQKLTEEQALEEIIADAAHEFITDRNFANQVAEDNPSLAKAILDSIRNALRMLRRIFANGEIEDQTHMNSLFSQIGILSEAEELWLSAFKQAAVNRAAVGIEDLQNKIYEETRYSTMEEKWENDEKLSNSKFNSWYYAHKLNLKGRDNLDEQIADIKENGFKGGSGAINVMPVEMGNGDVISERYGIKAGETALLVPKKYVKNDKVVQGFKPRGYEIVTAERDFQPYYELYSKAYDEIHARDVRFSITPEQQETIEHNVGPDVRFSVPTWRETLAKAIFNSSEGFSAYSGKQSGRQKTYELTKNNFSEEQAKAVTDYMDMMAAWFEKTGEGSIRAKYKFIGWDDLTKAEVQVRKNDKGEIVSLTVSAMVKNGEYPVNFDLTTVCNKREGFSEVIKNLIDTKVPGTNENVLNTIRLTDQNMWKINQALKAEGIDTACLGCFVEARRYYAQNFMNKIDDKWNSAVRKARRELGLPEEEYFNFAKGKEVSGEEWSAIDDLWSAYDESKESKSSPADRIKILMDEIVKNKETDSPYLKLIQMSDISTPEGYNAFKQLSTKGHDMVKTIKSIYGTSAPKEILAFTPYNSEIALLPENMKGMPTGDYLRSIGGIRVQSFSDFKIEHVFDHFQMVADEAARKFVTHGYSKVIAFPRIFGLTGRKINMSVMFDVLPNRAWSQALGIPVRKAAKYAKKYQGLQFVKEKPAENPDNRPYIETEIEGVHGYLTYLVSDTDYVNSVRDREYQKNLDAGMSEDEARRKANEAKPFEQSINYKDAVELENQDGYKENIGIIAVAYGDEHLKVLMSDPNVRYIIPYHKSGLPTFISKKTSLAIARDYTNFQNTNIAESWKDANGKEVDFRKEFNKFVKEHKDEKYPAIEFFKQINDNKYKVKFGSKTASQKSEMAGTADFDVYKDLDSVKDIREVSNAYLEHCIKNGWCPVFHEFAGDPNYYKMIFDFAVTDGTTTNIYPQRAVRNNYPGLDIDAKVAAGEEITEADLAGLKEAVEKGAKEQNDKNMIRSNNMGNVMNDLLSRDTENSIIADTNLQSIRWNTPDYTDVKLGNEEMTPKKTDADVRLSISANLDEDYMDAVNSGNMEEAQKYVDEAAKMAGFPTPLYHGTDTFGFTTIDSEAPGADGFSFWTANTPEASATYTAYGKVRKVSESPSEEELEAAYEEAEKELDDSIDVFRDAIDHTFSEWYFGRQDNRIIKDAVLNARPDAGYGDGVYDVLIDMVGDAYSEFGEDYQSRYDEFYEFQESDEFEALENAIIAVESAYTRFYEAEAGDIPGGIYALYANTDNMYALDAKGKLWNELRPEELPKLSKPWSEDAAYRTRDVANWARDNGYDGVVFKNIRDNGSYGRTAPFDVYAFFNPQAQVKSADTVTYAEDGSVIPLSERFDPTNNDIRYSLPTQDSDGNILTDGQMEYFKNSQARDAEGRLQTMYHGTESAGFTVFNSNYGNSSRFFFFTDSNDRAKGYSGTHDRFNAATYNSVDEANEYIKSWGNDDQVVQDGDEYAILEDGEEILRNTSLSDLMMEYDEYSGFGGTAANYAVYLNVENPLVVNANGKNWDEISFDDDIVTTNQLAEYAFDEGYDGLIIDNVLDYGLYSSAKERVPQRDIVVFSSNQIKDTRNENPSENPDIRYSVPDEDELIGYLTETAESMDDMFYTDPMLEEGRRRLGKAKADFIFSKSNKWNERWLTKGLVLDEKKTKRAVREAVMNVMSKAEGEAKYKNELVNEAMKTCKRAFYLMKIGKFSEAGESIYDLSRKMVEDNNFFDDAYEERFNDYVKLRKYIRARKFYVPDLGAQEYAEHRKADMGKIWLCSAEKGTSIEDEWPELCRQWPEWFDIDEAKPTEMLFAIEDALEAARPMAKAYCSEEAADYIDTLANQLYDIVYEGDEYQSIADKYKKAAEEKTAAMKLRFTEAMQDMQELKEEHRSEIKDLKATYKQNLKTQKMKYEFEIAELKQNREYNIQRLKAEKARAVKEERRKSREKQAEKRSAAQHRKMLERITDKYNTLCKWVLDPTKEKNVPEEFRVSLAEFLQTLDLQTYNSKALEEKTGHVAYKTFRMRELKDRLNALAASKSDADGNYTPGIFEVDAYVGYLMESLSNKLDGKPIDALDNDAISDIDTIMKAIIKNIQRYKEVKLETKNAELSDIGDRAADFFIKKRERDGVYGKHKGALGALETINATALTPAYLFDRMGPFKEMYDVLRHNGFDTYIRNEKMITDKLTQILSPYYNVNNQKGKRKKPVPGSEVEKWRDDRSAQTIELSDGNTVTMTVAQMMSLYCLSRRGDQALGHMCVGGILVTPIQTGSKIEAAKQWVKKKADTTEKRVLSREDVDTIIGKLTPDQKKVAEQLQELMSVDMAKLGNEAHRELYGYEMFNEPNYFPIKVHGNERSTDINTIGEVFEKIKSFGFTKPLTPQANKAIEIDDIFSVVADHCNGMNLYNAYLVPITDFMKVFNYTYTAEDGEVITMKEAIEQVYGKDILKYILNMMKDINGIRADNRGGLEGIMNSALGTAKKTAVFGNIRVALQQPTAIIRAFAEVKPKYFTPHVDVKLNAIPVAQAAERKAIYEEMYKYCPIAQWKAWGYYDTYMGRDIEDVMMNQFSMSDIALSGLYGALDNMTWSAIWQAVKSEQEDLHPDMDFKSDEFLQICGRRASEVFDKTQVVDSTFHRSDAMRNKQVAVKAFTAFMSEPTLTLNVFRAGLYNFREEMKAGNKAEAYKILGTALGTIAAQAIVVSAAQAVADAWRGKDPGFPWDDDDDDKDKDATYKERFYHNLVQNIFDQLHLENNMYLVKDVTPYINYMISKGADHWNWNPTLRAVMGWDQDYLYSQNNLIFAGLENTANGIAQAFKKLEKGEDYDKTWYDVIQKAMSGIGTFTGIPVGTLMRDFHPIWDKFFAGAFAMAELPTEKPLLTSTSESSSSTTTTTTASVADDDNTTTYSKEKPFFGLGKSDYEKHQEELEKERQAEEQKRFDKIESIKEKTADLEGEAKARKIWSSVTKYMKDEEHNGKSLKEYIHEGDFYTIEEVKTMYMQAGGSVDYFNERMAANCKSELKKTISSDNTEEQVQAQQRIKEYMLNHGVTEAELSEIAYNSRTAKQELKIAFRINDHDAIVDEMTALIQAGISRDDLYRIYDNRNKGLDLKKYKESGGKYADRLKSTGVYNWPINGSITSRFGHRSSPGGVGSTNHQGLDIAGSMGDPVGASDGGTVVYAGWYGGAGKTVMIEHDDGTVTQYSHLSWYDAQPGDIVAQGQYIGKVGSTGNSTGPHLHFGVKVNGVYQDPETYLANR